MTIVVVLGLGDLAPGATVSKWEQVARTQATYATTLAVEHVRLDLGFFELADRFVTSCDLMARLPDQSRGLDEQKWHSLYVWTKGICRPWLKLIYRQTQPCESNEAPEWCIDHKRGRKRFKPLLSGYFNTLSAAMKTTEDPLAHYNMISLAIDQLDSAFIREFSREVVASWFTPLVTDFLATASARDGVEIAKRMRNTWVGFSSKSKEKFQQFAQDSSRVSPSERETLLATVADTDD